MKRRKFTIDRAKWRCGESSEEALGLGDTMLLNQEGYMCCLGQVSLQCDMTKADILKISEPCEWDIKHIMGNDKIEILAYPNDEYDTVDYTKLTNEAITINDADDISQEMRELKLKELFAEHNIDLEFVGEGVRRIEHKEIEES